MLTQERLKYLVSYDPMTGIFTRNVALSNRIKVGAVAGSIDTSTGYIRFLIDGKRYYAHRLAWLYMYGYMPSKFIDHINHITTDNRISNLREATHSENNHNMYLTERNTSGVKGVSWIKAKGRWRASVKINGKSHHVGYYLNLVDAEFAIKRYRENLHGEFHNHG